MAGRLRREKGERNFNCVSRAPFEKSLKNHGGPK